MATAYITKVKAIPAPPSAGELFWVDGIHGADANTGRSPLDPLKTIAAALALCTADHDDYIYVMDCWQQEDTWPIVVNKTKVHIIGVANPIGQFPKMQPTDNNPVFRITASGQYSEIAGFDLGGWDDAGNTSACIELDNAISTWIHHCQFGSEGAKGQPQDGIRFIAGNSYGTLIEDCVFYGTAASGYLTRDGINFDFGNNFHSIVRNNIFNGLPTIAIFLASNATGVTVERNRIACDADTEGSAISLAATTADCFIVDNKAIYGQDAGAMTKNPYKDDSAPGSNHWALNYKGNALAVPA